jgi:hypothetical protein
METSGPDLLVDGMVITARLLAPNDAAVRVVGSREVSGSTPAAIVMEAQ